MASQATAILNKNDQGDQLRGQVRTMTAELTDLRAKLAHASGALAILNDKRQKFTEDAAAGKQPKPSEIAALAAEITAAQIPFDGLTAAVRTKEGQLAQTRDALDTLERELAIEAQQEARRARFAELKTELIASGAVIGETLRRFVEEELPRFDAARDALILEIIGGRFAQATTNEGREARELIHRVMQEWTAGDASTPAIRRKLLRSDPAWTTRGDIRLEIENLSPPKR